MGRTTTAETIQTPADQTAQPVRLTVLEAVTGTGGKGPALNKLVTVTPDGTLEKRGYGRAYLFRRWLTDPVTDIAGLAAVLARIERNPQLCIVSGRPVGPLPLKQPARRLKHPDPETGHPATLEDYPARFLPIDLDGLTIPGADIVLDPEGAVDAALEALGPEFAEVSCYWQFTAGQRPDSEELRLRLYFLTDREHTGADLARWAKHLRAAGVPVDPAIYSGAQPIYTAAPTFADGRDLLPVRSGFLERAEDVVALTIPEADPETATHDGGNVAALGLEKRLERIGDHPGGDGIHEAIRGAIAAAAARYGSALDREDLKRKIREAVGAAVIDPRKHPGRYLREQTSDRMLDASIDGAVRKFGAEADACREHLARLRQTPHGLPAYPAPTETPETLTPEAAQERLQAIVADMVAQPKGEDGKPRRVVVKAPTGLGKTTVTVEAAQGECVLWFAPTKLQAGETAARFRQEGTSARHVLGREAMDPAGEEGQGMCWRDEELKALKAKGLARYTARLLCQDMRLPTEVRQCPYFGRCGHTRQLLDQAPVTVAAHEYLPLDRAEVIAKAAKAARLAVVDENALPALMERHHWPADDLIAEGGTIARIVADLIQGRPLVEIVQGLDLPAVVEELKAARETLPGLSLPDVIPGAPGSHNLAALSKYEPVPRGRLRGAYDAMLEAIQGAYNRLWASTDGDGRHVVRSARLKPARAVEGLPVLVLDATADEAIARAMWGEGVEFHHWHVEPKGLEVVQVRDRTLHKKGMVDTDNRALRDRAAALVQATGAALVTYKEALERMREEGTLPPGTLAANFNGLRGLDGMKDAEALVVAGRIEPPAYALEAEARALWPDRPLDLGHTDLIQTASSYRLRDGTETAAVVRAHPDPLVNRMLIQKRDAELVQAVGRLRAIHGREGRRLYLLTNVPVPGLTVDRLVNLDDLLPDGRACRGLVAGGGVLPLAPRALVELLPGEWASENAAKLWGRDTLIKGWITGKEYSIRDSTPLFHPIRYRVRGQAGQMARALTWHTDPAAIRQRLEALHGAEVVRLELPEGIPAPVADKPLEAPPPPVLPPSYDDGRPLPHVPTDADLEPVLAAWGWKPEARRGLSPLKRVVAWAAWAGGT